MLQLQGKRWFGYCYINVKLQSLRLKHLQNIIMNNE